MLRLSYRFPAVISSQSAIIAKRLFSQQAADAQAFSDVIAPTRRFAFSTVPLPHADLLNWPVRQGGRDLTRRRIAALSIIGLREASSDAPLSTVCAWVRPVVIRPRKRIARRCFGHRGKTTRLQKTNAATTGGRTGTAFVQRIGAMGFAHPRSLTRSPLPLIS